MHRSKKCRYSITSSARGMSVGAANHSTEIYWFAGSAAAVAMYFE
jgi:hypothetical protein